MAKSPVFDSSPPSTISSSLASTTMIRPVLPTDIEDLITIFSCFPSPDGETPTHENLDRMRGAALAEVSEIMARIATREQAGVVAEVSNSDDLAAKKVVGLWVWNTCILLPEKKPVGDRLEETLAKGQKTLYLDRLAVHPEFLVPGIIKSFCEWAIEKAEKEKLEIVVSSCLSAKEIYEAVGSVVENVPAEKLFGKEVEKALMTWRPSG